MSRPKPQIPASPKKTPVKKPAGKPASKPAPKKRGAKPGVEKPKAQKPIPKVDAPPDAREQALINTLIKKREKSDKVQAAVRSLARDIGPLNVAGIDWTRRTPCKFNLKLFCETYLKPVFSLGWSKDHELALDRAERSTLKGERFAIGMPRGQGKTAICRGDLLWATLYGHRQYAFNIGSNQKKATETMDFVMMQLFQNPLLIQDFPEVCHAIVKLDNRYHLATGQSYRGTYTHIYWTSEMLQYPCCILNAEDAEPYQANDPDSLLYVPQKNGWLAKSGGTIIKSDGIDGSIRGSAEVHPILLTQRRPDMVILDDVQKDQRADSPASCEKLINLIEGAVMGLAGPNKSLSALMPCTVIREGDASDTFLDRMKKPTWRGQRTSLVIQWPEGIDDYNINPDTEAGKLWTEYARLRDKSNRELENETLNNDFFAQNFESMTQGFLLSWPERYDVEKELSAHQHAMNLRLESPSTFPAEYQNKGRKNPKTGTAYLTVAEVSEKMVSYEQYELPPETEYLSTYIDVQNESLWFLTLGTDPYYTGIITDYGTFPELPERWTYYKYQFEGYKLLTKRFFEAYPHLKNTMQPDAKGKYNAPLEAKIYEALWGCVEMLSQKEFHRQDGYDTIFKIKKIAIDSRWGLATDVIKRFCREAKFPGIEIIPATGQAMMPQHKQFEEYTKTPGWLFEDQVNPSVREVKWVLKPDNSGQRMLTIDTNRMKTAVTQMLAAARGLRGSVSLFNALPGFHDLLAEHLVNSEYPELIFAKGREKEIWLPREGRPDNEFLDCLAGAAALAGLQGCSIQANPLQTTSPRTIVKRKLSEWKHQKNQARRDGQSVVPNVTPGIVR